MQDEVRAAVASAVRAEIARRHVDQRTLATKIGRSQSWVSRQIRGKSPHRVEDLVLIAEALDVPVAALLPQTERAA